MKEFFKKVHLDLIVEILAACPVLYTLSVLGICPDK